MTWFLFVEGLPRLPLAPGVEVTVGRAADCDIRVVGHTRVSRQHLVIEVTADGRGWRVADVSSNGSMSQHGEFSRGEGTDPLVLVLGGQDGPLTVLSTDKDVDLASVSRPAWSRESSEMRSADGEVLGLGGGVRFGRDPNNDIVIPSLLASPHHARVIEADGRATIIDLNSARGTFVNGRRVKEQTLVVGDSVTIGGQTFRYREPFAFLEVASSDGVAMSARGVTVMAGTKTLLSDISFDIPPRSLVAVIGPSGSGKSTMLGALTGLRHADQGSVLLDHQDLYQTYDDWRFRIGFVPQQDLVPAQLTVQQAISYAARLRFPDDTTEHERQSRIEEVLRDLRLMGQIDQRIDRLSGGQRKRVSVALELLTRPPVLFLDEPTSGLDPGLDQQLMMLLRELANDGRTVVVVTHAMDNLHLCDQVMVLAAPGTPTSGDIGGGGRLAFMGAPGEALDYFGASDWAGVFLTLEKRSGADWARRYQDRRTQSQQDAKRQPASPLDAPRPGSALRQWVTLVQRTWRSTISDRSYAALLLLLPVVLAGLGFLVGNAAGLGPDEDLGGLNPDTRILILILILGATFTGAATTIAEFVKERIIYKRERAVGMSRVAYVTSKGLVLGAIAAGQGLVFALLTLVGRPGAQNALITGWGHLDVALIVALLAMTSAMLGLALSALIPTREGTLPVLVIATMLQVVLSGAIPLRWDIVVETLGRVIPAYWAFEALAALTDLSALLGQVDDPEWGATTADVLLSVSMLVGMAAVLVALATLLVRRSDPGRR
ncbi:MAG: ATP-binding cassette domain-containing protein [Candidatus Nanopelagicales bacterium]